MLMRMELMLNGVNLSLVTFMQQPNGASGAVLVFLIFRRRCRNRDRHSDRAVVGAS